MTMADLIQLSSQMQWPFTFAVLGLGAAVCIMFVVGRTSRLSERNEIVRRKNELEIKRLELTIPNKAMTLTKRGDDNYDG